MRLIDRSAVNFFKQISQWPVWLVFGSFFFLLPIPWKLWPKLVRVCHLVRTVVSSDFLLPIQVRKWIYCYLEKRFRVNHIPAQVVRTQYPRGMLEFPQESIGGYPKWFQHRIPQVLWPWRYNRPNVFTHLVEDRFLIISWFCLEIELFVLNSNWIWKYIKRIPSNFQSNGTLKCWLVPFG